MRALNEPTFWHNEAHGLHHTYQQGTNDNWHLQPIKNYLASYEMTRLTLEPRIAQVKIKYPTIRTPILHQPEPLMYIKTLWSLFRVVSIVCLADIGKDVHLNNLVALSPTKTSDTCSFHFFLALAHHRASESAASHRQKDGG